MKKAIDDKNYKGPRRRKSDKSQTPKFGELVGDSPAIHEVFRAIEKVAITDSTVLITGESGTGKELIARAVHYTGDRKDKPMVVINCGAIPGELLESELFGHEKGAFTGAHRTRIGRFEMADNGTIFLDEIGDMSPNLQVKLLRVLQEQSFERVGSTKPLKVNVRIIAATNKNLQNSIKDGKFREDLFYRLNVIPIHVPPLRERKTDIPMLKDFFLSRLGGRRLHDRRRMKSFLDSAMELMIQYDWPGNIRELENTIERLSVLVEDDVIGVADLPEKIRGGRETDLISAFWDIMPTLADIAGAYPPNNIDGISMLPTLMDIKGQDTHDHLYWEYHSQGGKQAVRKGKWKALRLNYRDKSKTTVLLFNLDDDPSEERDIADCYPELTKEMIEILENESTYSDIFPFHQE